MPGEENGSGPRKSQNTRNASKRKNRQAEARRRQQLKPFSDKVRQVERKMASHRKDLEAVEESLHDETLYTDESRKTEMTSLMQKQAELKETLAALEWDWLEASEALEKAEKKL